MMWRVACILVFFACCIGFWGETANDKKSSPIRLQATPPARLQYSVAEAAARGSSSSSSAARRARTQNPQTPAEINHEYNIEYEL